MVELVMGHLRNKIIAYLDSPANRAYINSRFILLKLRSRGDCTDFD